MANEVERKQIIKLSRRKGFMFSEQSFKIFIDDVCCGDMNRDEIKEISVDIGKRSIYV